VIGENLRPFKCVQIWSLTFRVSMYEDNNVQLLSNDRATQNYPDSRANGWSWCNVIRVLSLFPNLLFTGKHRPQAFELPNSCDEVIGGQVGGASLEVGGPRRTWNLQHVLDCHQTFEFAMLFGAMLKIRFSATHCAHTSSRFSQLTWHTFLGSPLWPIPTLQPQTLHQWS